MTVQVMSGQAAGAPAEPAVMPEEKQPYVYTPPEPLYEIPERSYRARERHGFGSVLAVQLVISALLGLALWAGINYGSEGIREICGGLTELFR